MSGFRVAALDLDGTLLRSDGSVSARTRAALAAAQDAGVTPVVATARSPRSARGIAADLGVGGYAVCLNGATLYDLDRQALVTHRPLDAETVRAVVEALRAHAPGVVFGWEDELRFGSEAAFEELRDPRWPRPEGAEEATDVLGVVRPLTKLVARHPEIGVDDLYAIVRELAGASAAVTLAGYAFVEVAAPGVTKAAGLAELCELLGVPQAETLAFGDHVTDAPMLAWAGLGVAVANAHPDALAAADEVAPANDEDGVAQVLERVLGL